MTLESEFSFNEAIDFEPLTVNADASVKDVVALLSQRKSSCVLVLQQRKLIGIYTERDVVKMTAKCQSFGNLKITDVMSSKLISITASQFTDIFVVLNLMRHHRIRHLPILNELQELIGIITPKTIRKVFKPADMLRSRLVCEMMETQVVQASPQESLLSIALLMANNQVSCVVITEINTDALNYPIGIITEFDIVKLRSQGWDFDSTMAKEVMSKPLKPIRSQNTLWLAHQKMEQENIRRLVVVDADGKLSGIVTQSRLLQALDPLEMQSLINILQQTLNEKTVQLQNKNKALEEQIKQCRFMESVLSDSECKYRDMAQKLEVANHQLQKLANSDSLTALANRRYFDNYLQEEWKRLSTEKAYLSVIMCDVDCFKIYNDTYGHQLGDESLKKIARVLQECTKRPADLAARYGGEEFIILLPNTDLQKAIHIANKVSLGVKYLKIPHINSYVSNFVTVSLGLATTIPKFNQLPESLIAAADKKLYKAKSAGRNCITFY